jgi:hypothetical protein
MIGNLRLGGCGTVVCLNVEGVREVPIRYAVRCPNVMLSVGDCPFILVFIFGIQHLQALFFHCLKEIFLYCSVWIGLASPQAELYEVVEVRLFNYFCYIVVFVHVK